MGMSECYICKECDYLDEFWSNKINKSIWVCRNCVIDGIDKKIKEELE